MSDREDLSEVLGDLGVTVTFSPTDDRPDWDNFRGQGWCCKLTMDGRTFNVPRFFTGDGSVPTPADVVWCIIGDTFAAEQSFEDFCADFGYDTDSRRAYATWEASKASSEGFADWLGEHYSRVLEAERKGAGDE